MYMQILKYLEKSAAGLKHSLQQILILAVESCKDDHKVNYNDILI